MSVVCASSWGAQVKVVEGAWAAGDDEGLNEGLYILRAAVLFLILISEKRTGGVFERTSCPCWVRLRAQMRMNEVVCDGCCTLSL